MVTVDIYRAIFLNIDDGIGAWSDKISVKRLVRQKRIVHRIGANLCIKESKVALDIFLSVFHPESLKFLVVTSD